MTSKFHINNNMGLLRAMVVAILCILNVSPSKAQAQQDLRIAPAPLYRDPITDGAADPVVFWNPKEKSWWMLYTQRRANTETADVAYCYGTAVGVASSQDNGRSWAYRGTLDLQIEKGHNTFWAPDIIYEEGQFHMFVAYIPGVYNHWNGTPRMAHYVATDPWEWKFIGFVELPYKNVIDATVLKTPSGSFRMWYKGPGSHTYLAESRDLKTWTAVKEPAIAGNAHEGPKAFYFQGSYWMLTDEWKGMRVYRSTDMNNWERQGLILDKAGKRKEDGPSGAHGDVMVVGDKAYVFYFTHPGRTAHTKADNNKDGVLPYALRRSSIQVAELKFSNNTLTCNQDEPFDFFMPNQ